MWNTCLSFSCKTCLSHNVIYFPTVCASLFLRLLVAVLLFQWLMYIGRNASPIKIQTSTRIKCCSPKQISLMAVCGNKLFVLICEESTLHLFKLIFCISAMLVVWSHDQVWQHEVWSSWPGAAPEEPEHGQSPHHSPILPKSSQTHPQISTQVSPHPHLIHTFESEH